MSVFFSCNCCKQKICLIVKKPCTKVEKILRDCGIMAQNWIRPKISRLRRDDGYGPWREIPISVFNYKVRGREFETIAQDSNVLLNNQILDKWGISMGVRPFPRRVKNGRHVGYLRG